MDVSANRTKCEISLGSGSHALTSRVMASKFVQALSVSCSCKSTISPELKASEALVIARGPGTFLIRNKTNTASVFLEVGDAPEPGQGA